LAGTSPFPPKRGSGELYFVYISGKFPSDARLLSPKKKKYPHRHPAHSRLEYIYFMKSGQPKLSEKKSQRSGLRVTPIKSEDQSILGVDDFH
jgi:hypothetical protein